MLNKNTVFDVKKRWERQQTLLGKVGSGRRQVSTLEEDGAFLNVLGENPLSSAVEATIQTNFPGSPAPASTRVKSSELKYRVATSKPYLSEEHKQSRIIFSQNYVYRDLDYLE
ncbi:hypothetical protein QE152_g8093 [Popillia japonica]|uniref:Uncharacterized protein n=1 Tax=Popillia japonica TaxID=7064 RepID=A0AAW1ME21_POPJA